MIVRPETAADTDAVHRLNATAFPTDAEAGLVDRLRASGSTCISLVADSDQAIAGHILFSPVTLNDQSLNLMGLAPMAVAPDLQRNGIGTQLVEAGLAACRDTGVGGVAVLGHPEFYPRFGFAPASGFGIDCEYDVPDDVFMMMELQAGYLDGKTGTIRYHPAFAEL